VLAPPSLGLRDAALLRRTWCSLARLAEERGDEIAAQQAWKNAAALD
jgi:HemY protein